MTKSPPEELTQAWDVQRWGVLPEAGGLRDQRIGELERLTAALNVYNATRGFWSAKDRGQWANDNPGLDRIYAYVIKLQRDRDRGKT